MLFLCGGHFEELHEEGNLAEFFLFFGRDVCRSERYGRLRRGIRCQWVDFPARISGHEARSFHYYELPSSSSPVPLKSQPTFHCGVISLSVRTLVNYGANGTVPVRE